MGIKKDQEELELLCTKSKYGNFKEGKTYTAIARASMGNKYTDFRIEDEDGDLYTIEEKNLKESGPLQFKIVEKTIETFEEDYQDYLDNNEKTY